MLTSDLHENAHFDVVCDSKDRQAWLEARQTGIGASEIAAVLGESTYMSALELYLTKISDAYDRYEGDEPEHIEFGRKLEDFIAGIFQERTGYPVCKAGHLLRSKAHPWMLATLDYEAYVDGEWLPLEIKNVGATKLKDWENGTPTYFRWQGHQQMEVTRKPRMLFAGFVGGNRFLWDELEQDTAARDRIVTAGREFWRRVQERQPPPPDGSESAERAVRSLAGQACKSVVELEGNYIGIFDQIKELQKAKKQAETQLNELKQSVKLRLGSDTHGLLPDGRSFSFKEIQVAGKRVEAHDVAPSSYRKLLLHKSKEGKR